MLGVCEHELSPYEALDLAKELRKRALAALRKDAAKNVEVVVKDGMVDKDAIGAILSKQYPLGSPQWRSRLNRLWCHLAGGYGTKRSSSVSVNHVIWIDERMKDASWGRRSMVSVRFDYSIVRDYLIRHHIDGPIPPAPERYKPIQYTL
jgi:hypothetical protein